MTSGSLPDKAQLSTDLAVNPWLCLRLRHKKSSCRLCLQNCPLGAIRFDETLQIDHSLCSGCGICVNLCPTGVFKLKDFACESLLASVKEASSFEFSCTLSATQNSDFKVPCLGYLDASILIGIIARGSRAVVLNVAQCKKCRSALGLQIAAKSLGQANRILALFGMPEKISISTEEPSGSNNPEEGRLYSRREFFFYFRRKTQRLMAVTEEANNDREMETKTQLTLKPRLPQKRSLLLEHIRKLGQPVVSQVKAADFLFTDIEINEHCDGCEMCTTFCPTGALRAHDQEDSRVTDFNLGYCLACGLCSDICPKNAIAYSAWLNPGEIVNDGRKVLMRHRKLACTHCGQAYVSVSGNGLCLSCQKQKEIKKWLALMCQRS